jgi:hypothetical protein
LFKKLIYNLQEYFLGRSTDMNVENIRNEERERKEEKEQKEEVPLPVCTTAPDPEHHRASDEDEPCDDARSGPDELTQADEPEEE